MAMMVVLGKRAKRTYAVTAERSERDLMSVFSKQVLWAGAVAFGLIAAPLPASAHPAIDFGNDGGDLAKDGECDDLRFIGEGMAEILLTDEIGRDASDCRSAYSSGKVSLNPLFVKPASEGDFNFGDDRSAFANDGECDDIRFVHDGSSGTVYLAEDVGHDATDCKAGVEAGLLTWQGDRADIERGITARELMDLGIKVPEPTT